MTKEVVFKVLTALTENPNIKWDDIGMNKTDFYDALDIIDQEKYATNITFARGGRGNPIQVAYWENSKLTMKGIDFLKKCSSESGKQSCHSTDGGSGQSIECTSFLDDLIWVCGEICNNAYYNQDTEENVINDFVRTLLIAKGYLETKDQTRHGISETGKRAGSVDILVTKNRKEIALIEGLNLSSVDSTYIDKHIEKSILNYNALGTATYILAYVNSVDYQGFWIRYYEHLKAYRYPCDAKEEINPLSNPNAALRVAKTVIIKDGYEFPVFYITVNVRK